MSVLRRRMMQIPPDLGYVPDGLVLHLDGIYNTLSGHNASATHWADLSTKNVATTVDELAQWEAAGLYVSGKHGALAQIQPFGLEPLTFEVSLTIFRAPTLAVIISNDDPDGILSGTLDLNHGGRFSAYWRGSNSYGAFVKDGLPIPYGQKVSFSGVSYGNTVSLYMDSIEKDTVSGGRITKTPGNLTIGYAGYVHYNGIEGIIHSVRVYDRVLTADEIAHNYAIDKRRFEM